MSDTFSSATRAVRAALETDSQHNAVVPPLHLTSTYAFKGFGEKGVYDYTRSGNPTRDALGDAIASLEGAEGAVITASGMAAVTLVAYVQRSARNGATKAIENDLHITSQDLGWVMSGWYLLNSLFQLPGGWVADRLGSKPALILFAVSWSLLTGLAGLAGGLLRHPGGRPKSTPGGQP